jgi:hypothetical protein
VNSCECCAFGWGREGRNSTVQSAVFSCPHEMSLEYNWGFMVHVEREESNEEEKE